MIEGQSTDKPIFPEHLIQGLKVLDYNEDSFIDKAVFIQRVIAGFEHNYLMNISVRYFNKLVAIAEKINKEK